jgi:hydrogenase maturation protease
MNALPKVGQAPATVVIGVGNLQRGDDAVGRLVARRLLGTTGARVVEREGEPAAIVEVLGEADRVFLVDAAEFGARPGTVLRLDAGAAALPDLGVASSTHGLGLVTAIELARALGQLPAQCVVYAVQGGDYRHGAPSQAVAAAVEAVAQAIRAELHQA